ncbi:MAG: 3-phosphoglycerate dehydrogenase [Thaumarchaeota archaeon]|nr:3-phosphoglycerate dehydrogenase [Nitrososphaerota archaeon]
MIFSTERLHREARETLRGLDLVEVGADDHTLGECQVLLTWPSKMDASLLAKIRNLKAIQTISAGVDDIDFSLIPPGVRVYSNVGAYSAPAAEHAWALLLAAAKGIANKGRRAENYLLSGRTLLVLGCGAIGSEVARIGKVAFGMRTVGVSRSFKAPEAFDSRIPPERLVEALDGADAIVNSLPLNRQTRLILSYDALTKMKDAVVLVNIGRAETIDEVSIGKILEERPRTRFATDVFWRKGGVEDFDSSLWMLPNFCGTFHTAGGLGAEDALRYAEKRAAENVRLLLTTGRGENEVDPSDYGGLRS